MVITCINRYLYAMELQLMKRFDPCLAATQAPSAVWTEFSSQGSVQHVRYL